MERFKALIVIFSISFSSVFSQNVKIEPYFKKNKIEPFIQSLYKKGITDFIIYELKDFDKNEAIIYIFWKKNKDIFGCKLSNLEKVKKVKYQFFSNLNKNLGVSKDEDNLKFVPPLGYGNELVIFSIKKQIFYFEGKDVITYSPNPLKQKNRDQLLILIKKAVLEI